MASSHLKKEVSNACKTSNFWFVVFRHLIGGMDLGLERAGMECRWQVEIDPFCRRVLEKHWPGVKRYGDIRGLSGAELEPVHLIAGGFPCQDVSYAGDGEGITGDRSSLWSDFARLVGALRPQCVFVENVSALRNRGLALVLQNLRTLGFDAEWHCIPACALGAPHERDRIWIIAYDASLRVEKQWVSAEGQIHLPDIKRSDRRREDANVDGEPLVRAAIARGERHTWTVEPGVGRMVHGISDRVDRIRSLGNAVVPQVAEWIGRRILEATA